MERGENLVLTLENRNRHRFASVWFATFLKRLIALCCGGFINGSLAAEPMPSSYSKFEGKIGVSVKESIPDWPKLIRAPAGAPNIVLILLDDIGFGDTSTFGGQAQTPELDRLATLGLRYNNFNTAARCSPTRAALLTGRNHHRVGFGDVGAGGYPGYNFVWKDSTASVAEILRQNGYSTSAFGKWHNTPQWEITPTGPFDRWPTGRGFEYFYGFMDGMENQWEPNQLYRNTLPSAAAATPEQGYHLTADLVDDAIQWVAEHKARATEKPYFLYFAAGAVHAPHHVSREWVDRYRGKFDQGWDRLRSSIFQRQKELGVIPRNAKLTPRPQEMRAWDSLSGDQKKLYARQMEVYAGFVTQTDYEVGRLLKEVQSGPGADNTLVLYVVGDNGASAEGGPDGYDPGAATLSLRLQRIGQWGGPAIPVNLYVSEWGWMGNTPFKYWKAVASHFGGVRNPLVVSWPAKIKDFGGLRTQFTHVTDVAATLLDVIGIALPERVNGVVQLPFDGGSFARTFSDSSAPSGHRIQYFEQVGNRAIYQDGWFAGARNVWNSAGDLDFSRDRWELYNVLEDFTQASDLAKQQPVRLKAMQTLFDQEARKNDVYPLGGTFHLPGGSPDAEEPSLTKGKQEFIYFPSETRINPANVPQFNTSYRMLADVMIPQVGAEGVLATFGNRINGFAWYIKDNRLVYENHAGVHHNQIISKSSLPSGRVQLMYEFRRVGVSTPSESSWGMQVAGTGRLYINGEVVAEEKLPAVEIESWGSMALHIGRAAGSTVSTAFIPPFAFTGTLEKVSVERQ